MQIFHKHFSLANVLLSWLVAIRKTGEALIYITLQINEWSVGQIQISNLFWLTRTILIGKF